MNKTEIKSINLGLIIGTLGVISGVVLIVLDNLFIGSFGAIASAYIAYKGYQTWKSERS